MVKAIVGANWGDEGKGKITDMLAETSDVVIRFQGGANAGHTIINDYGRFALHILPSGTFYPHITNIIGNGVALDIRKLVDELKSLTDQGVPAPNLIVSERCQILMPYHTLQDAYEEERLAGKAFGSTKSGIAPFYSDKYAKIGIQVCDLFDEARLKERLTAAVSLKNVLFEHLYHKPALNVDELFQELITLREEIRPYVGDAVGFVHQALKEGKTILLEGQLGSMKDPDLGIFPMTTSSHTLAGFGCVGAAVPPTAVEDVICVTKAYSSSVGSHTEPFVSELLGEEGEEIAENHRFDEVEKLENMTPDERFAFWRGELSRCIRCNACRNVCPACSCEKCVFDNPASGISQKAAADSFEENMFHIIRAFHVAGRCTDCGECSRVCPQNIPLHLLNRKFIKDIDAFYGEYQAGEDTESRAPLTNFTFDDVEPSIVYKGGKK